jgi:hypothetical protein
MLILVFLFVFFADIIKAVVRHSAQDIYTKIQRDDEEVAPETKTTEKQAKPEKPAKGKKGAAAAAAEAEATEA